MEHSSCAQTHGSRASDDRSATESRQDRCQTVRAVLDRAARRTLDIVVSLAVLVVASPVLALIALAVVVESPGPVFYRADRVGRHGKRLPMWKFRKMKIGASGLPLTTQDDARLTAVGGLLAGTRLDELPQLWHVLRGEMSLVGPRPEDPTFVAGRAEDYDVILTVRPGLAGFSQLAFADERAILSSSDPMADYVNRLQPQKCVLDRLYVERASFLTNLTVLWWTVMTLLRRPVAVDRATGAIGRRRRAPVAQPSFPAIRPSSAMLLGPTQLQPGPAATSYAETVGASLPVVHTPPSAEAPPPLAGTM
jgi:lipopolysaccharide/colanic/teichoic acid biosynthesis glycosyltransferase